MALGFGMAYWLSLMDTGGRGFRVSAAVFPAPLQFADRFRRAVRHAFRIGFAFAFFLNERLPFRTGFHAFFDQRGAGFARFRVRLFHLVVRLEQFDGFFAFPA